MRKYCRHCGKPFEAKRNTARYCSDSCRVMASNARKLANRPPEPLRYHLTADDKKRAVRAAGNGAAIVTVAKMFRINEVALLAEFDADPEFEREYKQAKADAQEEVLELMRKGKANAMQKAWLAMTMGVDDYRHYRDPEKALESEEKDSAPTGPIQVGGRKDG